MSTTSEADRVALVIKSAVEHLNYARDLLHAVINADVEHASYPAIAAEQAVEMDIRHAVSDAGTLLGYLGQHPQASMGGAV